jgi:RNA polymerase sigma-70 factor (ECF subfamily)
VLDRFAVAFENADVSALAELLREDVTLEMPPLLTWFAGRQAVTRFLAASPPFAAPGQLQLVPVTANGQSAFAAYQRGSDEAYHAYAVTVPTVTTTGIARIVTFFDLALFTWFGLPREHGTAAASPPSD